jgi:hypothetical protein
MTRRFRSLTVTATVLQLQRQSLSPIFIAGGLTQRRLSQSRGRNMRYEGQAGVRLLVVYWISLHAPALRTSCLCTDGDTSATAKGSRENLPFSIHLDVALIGCSTRGAVIDFIAV